MGYVCVLCKRNVPAFAPRKFYEALKIRTLACLLTDWGPAVPVVAVTPPPRIFACGFAVLLAALSLRGFLRLRSTTLAAPCLWAALSATCLALGALLEPKLEGIGLSAFRFAIAATTLCPLMAVLGAKRPQDRGWQWVVLSLWIVLVWPAAQAVLLPAGIRVELFVAWKLFLWGLIGIGLLNYLPTKNWLAAIFVAAGQAILLRNHLWLGNLLNNEWSSTLGIGCLLIAALLITWQNKNKNSRDSTSRRSATATATSTAPQNNLHPQETQWQTFRNAYGAFWALRILGMVNQTAELRDWPLRLHWSGFETQEDRQPTEEQLAELKQTMSTLLRRFVAMDRG